MFASQNDRGWKGPLEVMNGVGGGFKVMVSLFGFHDTMLETYLFGACIMIGHR